MIAVSGLANNYFGKKGFVATLHLCKFWRPFASWRRVGHPRRYIPPYFACIRSHSTSLFQLPVLFVFASATMPSRGDNLPYTTYFAPEQYD